MTANDTALRCPNCAMPRRRLHFNGEVWHCTRCRSWWSSDTGFESQEPGRSR